MYQFLEHPSEAYVEIQANTVEEVFQEAALALFEIMTNTSSVEKGQSFDLQLEAPKRNLLLIDWLNRLILLHEVENVFLSQFDIRLEAGELWKLSAIVRGEKIHEKHEKRDQAKSATFGQFEWIQTEQGQLVRFVVDI